MKTSRSLVVLANLAAAVAVAAAPGALEDVLATDSAFAAMSLERGYRAAFQENLAPDGVLFRPTAVVGSEWLETHEAANGRLEWRPTAGIVACSGQMAVTTGPWAYTNTESGDDAAGHYLSVWRREAGGQWRVVLDHGIDHASSAVPAVPLATSFAALWPEAAGRNCRATSSGEALADAERALDETIRAKGLAAALQRSAVDGAIAYRDDSPPGPLGTVGAAFDTRFGEGSESRPQFASVEPGSNLGYSYGEIFARVDGSASAARAVYVRLWRSDGRHWRLALDMTTAIPSPET